jgi:hypothetical protein
MTVDLKLVKARNDLGDPQNVLDIFSALTQSY